MKRIFRFFASLFVILITWYSCSEKDYKMGELTPPTNLVITTEVMGASAANPEGDGSGDVKITLTADNALAYKIDYDASTALDLVFLPTGSVTRKFTSTGVHTYLVTAVAYGKGGSSTTLTKEVTVRFTYTPSDATIIPNLTGGTSKTWIVDKSVAGHFGVGPIAHDPNGSATDWTTPSWWSAGVNEKVASANCFYTTTFTFTRNAVNNTYTLQVTNPDGAFTKTGALASIPGIPATGDEGCYSYGGATSGISFIPASSKIPATAPSTQTSIMIEGNTTYIGYGSLQKEYEIMVLTPTYMYLRAQGTETGNAWYFKLIPL